MHRSNRALRIQSALLGMWIALLLTSGTTAAIAFPAMKRLEPALTGFPGAATSDHWSITAGHIANPVITIAMWAQVGLAAGVLATLWADRRRAGWIPRLRALSIGLATALLLALVVLVARSMGPAIRGYWDAAQRGDTAAAAAFKEEFDSYHPTSSRLMTGILIMTTAGLALALAQKDDAPA